MFKRATQAAGSKSRRQSSATDIGFPPPGASSDIPEPSSAISTAPPMAFPTPGSSTTTTTLPPTDPAFSSASWDHGGATSSNNENYSLLVTPSLPFEPDFFETFTTLCDVLIDVYRGVIELLNVPDKITPGVGELFAKADARVRKLLVASLVREFEDSGRQGVKAEVGGVGKVVLGGLM